MSESKFPPRIWADSSPIAEQNAVGISAHVEKYKIPEEIEYLSQQECNHLLREREAETWEEAANMAGFQALVKEDLMLNAAFHQKAKEARQGNEKALVCAEHARVASSKSSTDGAEDQ